MLAGAAIGSLIAAGVAGTEAALHVDMDDEDEAEAAASAAADLVAGGRWQARNALPSCMSTDWPRKTSCPSRTGFRLAVAPY